MTGALNAAPPVTLASAATTNIATAASNIVYVTGTTSITALGTIAAGATRTVVFNGVLTLTHNASSLILPYAANITTAAGDVAQFISLGSGNWRCVSYSRDTGVVAGTTAQYYRGDKTFVDFATDVRASVLTGLSLASSAAVTAADTILVAFGKLQAQISAKQATLVSGTNIKTINGSDMLGSGDVKISDVTLPTPSNGSRLALNTTYLINGNTTSGFSFLMPGSAAPGNFVQFIDMYGNWEAGAWSVAYDVTGGRVMGLTESMLVNRSNFNFKLVWSDATGGWRIV